MVFINVHTPLIRPAISEGGTFFEAGGFCIGDFRPSQHLGNSIFSGSEKNHRDLETVNVVGILYIEVA